MFRDALANGNWQLLTSVPGSQTNASDPDYLLYPNAWYKLVVFLSNTCNPSRSFNEITSNILYNANITTSIEKLELHEPKLLYNPVHNEAMIINCTSNFTFELINNLGQILQKDIHANGEKAIINISNYSPGIYYIKATTDTGAKTLKLLIN